MIYEIKYNEFCFEILFFLFIRFRENSYAGNVIIVSSRNNIMYFIDTLVKVGFKRNVKLKVTQMVVCTKWAES